MAYAVAAAQDADFQRLRALGLYTLGELSGLNRLLALVPQRVEDPWLAQARVDGLVLAGREAEACTEVPAGLARSPQPLYWAKPQVVCQLVAGGVRSRSARGSVGQCGSIPGVARPFKKKK